jgi:hypothetical protein
MHGLIYTQHTRQVSGKQCLNHFYHTKITTGRNINIPWADTNAGTPISKQYFDILNYKLNAHNMNIRNYFSLYLV